MINTLDAGSVYICTRVPTSNRGKHIYICTQHKCLAHKVTSQIRLRDINLCLLHTNKSRPHLSTYIITHEGQEGAVLKCERS